LLISPDFTHLNPLVVEYGMDFWQFHRLIDPKKIPIDRCNSQAKTDGFFALAGRHFATKQGLKPTP